MIAHLAQAAGYKKLLGRLVVLPNGKTFSQLPLRVASNMECARSPALKAGGKPGPVPKF